MYCEKCGNPVKDTEKFCPKCGAPVKASADNSASGGKASPKAEGSKADAGKAAEAVMKTAAAAVEGVKEAAGKGRQAWNRLSSKEGGKKKIIIAAAAAAVLLLLVVITANAASINNLLRKTFGSPEGYYQFVEKKTVNELADACGELYGIYLDSLNYYDKSIGGEVSIKLDEAGQDFVDLLGFAGIDISWLKNAKIGVNAAVKDSNFSAGISAAINKDEILSGKAVMDIQAGEVYFQLPELNKLYLGLELEEVLGSYDRKSLESFQEIQAANKEQLKAFPSEKEIEKLFKKYTLLALSCMEDVSKSAKTLKAEGVQQKCTELKVTIDADAARDIAETVLEEIQNDKDIEKIIMDIAEAMDQSGVYGRMLPGAQGFMYIMAGVATAEGSIGYADGAVSDAEEVYEAFLNEIENMLDRLHYIGDSDNEIIMKVYVDGKGNIKGRKIELKNKYSSQTVSILMPQKGNKFGFEFSADGFPLKLTGSGKKKGDTITGAFTVKFNGASVVDVAAAGLNTEELKKARLNGKLEVTASSGLGRVADLGIGNRSLGSMAAIISDIKLTLKAETTEKSMKYDLSVGYEEESIGTVSIALKTGNGSKAGIPGDKNVVMAEDEEDLLEWIEEMNWDKLISVLDKSDIPSDIVDAAEDITEMLEDGDISNLYRYLRYFR